MYIKNIKINNILSIEDIELSLPKSGLLLIDGYNFDDNKSNGAGKTAILSAISWCLYNKFPRDVSITDFIRVGTKESHVSLSIEIKNKTYHIKRSRPCSFTIFDDFGNEYIEEEFYKILNLTYTQFILIVYFTQGLEDRFINLNDTNKKNFILQIINLDFINSYKSLIDADLKILSKELLELNNESTLLSYKISTHEELLIDESALKEEISSYEEEKETYKIKIDDMLQQVTEDPNTSEIDELLNRVQKKINKINSYKGLLSAAIGEKSTVNKLKQPEDNFDYICPECNSELDMIKNKLHIHNSELFEKKMQEFNEIKNNKLSELDDKILKLQDLISEEDKFISIKKKAEISKSEIVSDFVKNDSLIKEFKNKINHIDELIKILNSKINNNIKNKNKIIEINKILSEVNINIQDKLNKQQQLECVSTILSPSGISAYVLDNFLDLFNDKVKEYLEQISTNMAYTISSFKENKSGSIVTKISNSLIIDGAKRPIGSLSGGELKMLSLVIDLSLYDVVCHFMNDIYSPVILDEPFEYIDNTTKEKLVSLLDLKSKEKSIILVDHSSEVKSMFSSIIKIEKKNGISIIKE